MDFMFKAFENFFQRTNPCIFAVIVNGLCTIVYEKTDAWYIEWQQVVQGMITIDNEWHNEWERMTTIDNEWKEMIISDSEWQQVVHWMKRHSTLQRMDVGIPTMTKTDTLLQVLDGYK